MFVSAFRRLTGGALAQMRDEEVASRVDVLGEYRLGLWQTPRPCRLQEVPMLLSGLALVATRQSGLLADEINPQAGQVTVDVLQNVPAKFAIRAVIENGMEPLMRVTEEEGRVGIFVHFVEQGFRFGQNIGREFRKLVAEREDFDSEPRLIHLLHLLVGQCRDEGPAIAHRNNQRERFETSEGLPDRALADVKAQGNVVLEKRLSREEFTAKDLPADPFGYELGCGQSIRRQFLQGLLRG